MKKKTDADGFRLKKLLRNAGKLLALQYRASRKTFFMLLLDALLSGAFPFLLALSIKKFLDLLSQRELFASRAAEFIAGGVLWVALLCAANLLMSSVNAYRFKLTQTSSYYVADIMRKTMFRKMETVALSAFDDADFRDKYNLANQQIGSNVAAVMSNLLLVMQSLVTVLSFVGTIVLYRLWIIVPVLLLMIPSVIFSMKKQEKYFMAAMAHTPERRRRDYFSDLLSEPEQQREMRVFRSAPFFLRKYTSAFQGFIRGVESAQRYDLKRTLLSNVLEQISTAAIYLFAFFFTLEGRYTIAEFTIITSACDSVRSSLATVIDIAAGLYGQLLFFDLYEDFLETAPEIRAGTAALPPQRDRTVRFRNVSFRYPNSERDALSDVSLSFEPGKTYAVVGPNGAGKSTLLKLLLRLYEPTGGEILLNGLPVSELALPEYGSLFAAVFQDYARYALTFGENAALSEEIDEARARRAYEDAGFTELSDLLPRSITKQFDSAGVEPSVGQWQKIALARAYYHGGDFLILDEPTSALDAAGEKLLYQSIRRCAGEKTVIYISHRMISTVFADQILFLEEGRLVEQGSHEELLAKNGPYSRMFRIQEELFLKKE